MKAWVLILCLLTAVQLVMAQGSDSLHISDTLRPGQVQQASLDRYGQLYLSRKGGQIERCEFKGGKPLLYSPDKPAEICLLEARNPLSLFAFYREVQEIRLLDRFLTPIESFSLALPGIGFVRMAAPAADNQVWLLDDGDFSIKKVNLSRRSISLQIPLDLLLPAGYYDIVFISEYQNQLFVTDRNSGILVFDNLGNYQSKIEVPGLDYVGFLDEEIYYLKDKQLVLQQLYTGRIRKLSLPPGLEPQRVLLTKEQLFLFTGNSLFICFYF